MDTFKNIGWLEQNITSKDFRVAGISQQNGYQLIKILSEDNLSYSRVKNRFPEAERVRDTESIIQDPRIDLVFISAQEEDDRDLVANILRSGKHVRVV